MEVYGLLQAWLNSWKLDVILNWLRRRQQQELKWWCTLNLISEYYSLWLRQAQAKTNQPMLIERAIVGYS